MPQPAFNRAGLLHKIPVVVLAALWLIPPVPGHADERQLEIVLLEGADCGACRLYQSFHDGYPTQLTGYVGVDEPIPMSVLSKAEIPDTIAKQFSPHDYWSQSLSVAVLDSDKVLYVGNISEASDIAHARIPGAIMAPATVAVRKQETRLDDTYSKHFKATWQLDYFVDVALGKRKPYPSLGEEMLGENGRLDVAANNVILWGSASTPFGNSLYIAERMHDVYETLVQVAGASLNFITLYGNGGNALPDTSTFIDGELRYVEAPVSPAGDTRLSPDAETMGRLFHSLKGSRNNLLVQVGHSGPVGAPLWGQLATIDARLLEKLVAKTGSNLVMVSGACNGGQFATAPNCGFFAAHPEVIATGCQKSPEALRNSDDYLGNFFTGIGSGEADLDEDGTVTFSEGHWYASASLEDHQIPYDSIDSEVDAFWKSAGNALPESISFTELLELAQGSGPIEEQWAVRKFAERVSPDTRVTTIRALEINNDALQALAGMTEASSAERNAAMALDYPLVLSSLARRLIWRAEGTPNEMTAAITRCGDQSIENFVEAAAGSTNFKIR